MWKDLSRMLSLDPSQSCFSLALSHWELGSTYPSLRCLAKATEMVIEVNVHMIKQVAAAVHYLTYYLPDNTMILTS